MSAKLQHECTRVPVTALSSCGPFLVAAEGPFLRFYTRQDHTYLTSKRVFQAQAIHGVSVHFGSNHHVTLVIWGGLLVRALALSVGENALLETSQFSNVAKAVDWILHLSPEIADQENGAVDQVRVCAAITAHNALLELTIGHNPSDGATQSSSLVISIAELTSSSRSILYSAHLLWESRDRILVAAGTAFGEIMYWSWTRTSGEGSTSHVHRVFLGHEGSIFGVQISEELELIPGQGLRRLLASCSDDRTVRVWDITGFSSNNQMLAETEGPEAQRTRHTGFSNASFDADISSTDCLAIGWGHISRVWMVRFLNHAALSAGVCLLSSGEDATSRTWLLVPNSDSGPELVGLLRYKLLQLDNTSNHNGKNIWSLIVHSRASRAQQVVMGGADSKIAACSLSFPSPLLSRTESSHSQFTVHDITSSTQAMKVAVSPSHSNHSHRSPNKAEFFRSYTFIDDNTFLLTTNSGKVYIQSNLAEFHVPGEKSIHGSTFVAQLEDLMGYSVCTGVPALGAAFIAGSKGSVYCYQRHAQSLAKIHTFSAKVGGVFVPNHGSSDDHEVILLVTLVGQNVAQLLHLNLSGIYAPTISAFITIPLFEESTGLTTTSMDYIPTSLQGAHLLLGFRKGSIALYCIPSIENERTEAISASLEIIIAKVHETEAVTSIFWIPAKLSPLSGNLVSTGRDGRLTIYTLDLATNTIHLIHSLTLPVGPNIEGIGFSENHLFVYGFTSKKFVLYDTVAEEEVMSVDTGGAHRSWTFQPSSQKHVGGTLVWTRASSMHICRQAGSSHEVIRPGGHGREIKAVAISTTSIDGVQKQFIATGAEDTDIKIFEYEDGEIMCRRTLRKHTTGTQHLQWSDDGEHLFSSGGCEEFYIWRVRPIPPELGGIGVVCEAVYQPESEYSDLRIMAFDARKRGSGFAIAMVFSNSDVKVYSYDPTAAEKWQALAKGMYFTSCLTQCVFLSSSTILTAGTDGHAVLWPLVCIEHPHPSISSSPGSLTWKQPARIHQSSSKTLAAHTLDAQTTLLVSGGDDGSLAFLLATTPSPSFDPPAQSLHTHPPIIVARAHASAVTACAILTHRSRIFVLTSGNDQWVRLWEVVPRFDVITQKAVAAETWNNVDPLGIRRVKRTKTNVADVSSMAVLVKGGEAMAKVLICGVGMEVVRIDWEEM